jgi:hypothetical protein
MATDFAREFKLFENLNSNPPKTINKSKKQKLTEAVSSTYRAAYDRLAKKFEEAIKEADELWTATCIDYGEELEYYNMNVADRLKRAAAKNIAAGVPNTSLESLCHTGNAKIDNIFSDYVDAECADFDIALGDGLYYDTFICYFDGTYEYVNLIEEGAFSGNIDDIECIVGIDYASGANIAWIRNEDDIEELENLLY